MVIQPIDKMFIEGLPDVGDIEALMNKCGDAETIGQALLAIGGLVAMLAIKQKEIIDYINAQT